MSGPQPDGKKTTLAINIFDLVLLKVENAGPWAPEFCWREPLPNSEHCTRVIGNTPFIFNIIMLFDQTRLYYILSSYIVRNNFLNKINVFLTKNVLGSDS